MEHLARRVAWVAVVLGILFWVAVIGLFVVIATSDDAICLPPNAHLCNARNQARRNCAAEYPHRLERVRRGDPVPEFWADGNLDKNRFMKWCISVSS